MEMILFAVVPIIAGFILFAVIQALVKQPGRALAVKFGAIGNMTGMNKAQIIGRVGPPTSVSTNTAGELLQWMATGYHIAIQFDDKGKFVAVTHEALV